MWGTAVEQCPKGAGRAVGPSRRQRKKRARGRCVVSSRRGFVRFYGGGWMDRSKVADGQMDLFSFLWCQVGGCRVKCPTRAVHAIGHSPLLRPPSCNLLNRLQYTRYTIAGRLGRHGRYLDKVRQTARASYRPSRMIHTSTLILLKAPLPQDNTPGLQRATPSLTHSHHPFQHSHIGAAIRQSRLDTQAHLTSRPP